MAGVYRTRSRVYYRPRRVVLGAGSNDVNISAGTVTKTVAAVNATITYDVGITAGTVGKTVSAVNASVDYSVGVTAGTVSKTVTPVNATLTYDVGVTAGTVSKTVTTVNAAVDAGTNITAGTVSKTVTPVNAAITYDVGVTAGTASKTVSAVNAAITYDVAITAGTVSKTVGAVNATLTYDVGITAGTATKTVTPVNAVIAVGTNITAGTVSKTVAPVNATIAYDVAITATTVSKTITAVNATITTGTPTFLAWLTHFEKTKPTSRRFQTVRELNSYPVTPTSAASFPAFVVHFEKTENKTNRRLQTVRLDRFQPKSGSTSRSARPQPDFITRTQRSRRLQRVIPTPGAFVQAATPAAYPGYNRPLEAHRSSFKRRLQEVVLTGTLPTAAPSATTYPAYGLPTAHGVSFRRRHLVPPRHDVYPATPTSTASIAAVSPVIRAIKRKFPRPDILITVVISASSTPLPVTPGLTDEQRVKQANRRKDSRRKALKPLVVPVFPITPTSTAPVTAFLLKESIRVKHVKARRDVPDHSVYPITPVDFMAFWSNTTIRRKETSRRLLTPLTVNLYPVTPASNAPFIAALTRPVVRQRFVYKKVFHPVFPGQAKADIICPVYVQGEITDTIYLSTAIRDGVTYVRGEIHGNLYVAGDMSDESIVRTHINSGDVYLQSEIC